MISEDAMGIEAAKLRTAGPKFYKELRKILDAMRLAHSSEDLLFLRDRIINDVAALLESVEGGASVSTIELVVTPATAKEMVDRLAENVVNEELVAAVKNGSRHTKMRVFITLPIDIALLTRLRSALDEFTANSFLANPAFERLSKQISREVLDVSPLKILGNLGL